MKIDVTGKEIHNKTSILFLIFRKLEIPTEIVDVSRIKYPIKLHNITLQEMCCGFLLSREMWYRKSVLPGTGAG